MTHIEGPIVNSFYDMALLSWHNAMHPPLPLLAHPPPAQTNFDFGDSHANIVVKDIDGAKERSRALLKEHHEYAAGDVPQGEPMFFLETLIPTELNRTRAPQSMIKALPQVLPPGPTTWTTALRRPESRVSFRRRET